MHMTILPGTLTISDPPTHVLWLDHKRMGNELEPVEPCVFSIVQLSVAVALEEEGSAARLVSLFPPPCLAQSRTHGSRGGEQRPDEEESEQRVLQKSFIALRRHAAYLDETELGDDAASVARSLPFSFVSAVCTAQPP